MKCLIMRPSWFSLIWSWKWQMDTSFIPHSLLLLPVFSSSPSSTSSVLFISFYFQCSLHSSVLEWNFAQTKSPSFNLILFSSFLFLHNYFSFNLPKYSTSSITFHVFIHSVLSFVPLSFPSLSSSFLFSSVTSVDHPSEPKWKWKV